jgi:NAD(P)-dependent dehydrogenase (short-subunit alcohol dehydrogenase family)
MIGAIVGKLDGKVAVITGATSGMALAGAKLFVDEGAHVFITGRRKDELDQAVELVGRNVTGVQGDSAKLDDLDRLFDTVKQEKGSVDVLWASAGTGAPGQTHRFGATPTGVCTREARLCCPPTHGCGCPS